MGTLLQKAPGLIEQILWEADGLVPGLRHEFGSGKSPYRIRSAPAVRPGIPHSERLIYRMSIPDAMPQSGYESVSVRDGVLARVKALFAEAGCSSVSEFVHRAIREKCEALEARHATPTPSLRAQTGARRPRPRRPRRKSPVPILLLLGALVLASLASPDARASYAPAPFEPDPWIAGNVTVNAQLAGYGPFDYTDDVGVRATLPGFVADSRVAAPWNVSWSKVYAPGALQETKIGDSVWTGTANWTLTTTGSPTCTLTQDTVDGVGKSLRFKATGTGAGQECAWRFAVSPALTVDLAKTRFLAGVDVLTAESPNYFHVLVGALDTATQGCTSPPCQHHYLIDTTASLGCSSGTQWNLANAAGASVLEQQLVKFPCAGGGTPASQINALQVAIDPSGSGKTQEIRLFALDLRVGALSLGADAAGGAKTNQTQAETDGVGLSSFAPSGGGGSGAGTSFAVNRTGDVRIAFRQLASTLPADKALAAYDTTTRTGTYSFEYLAPQAAELTYGAIVGQDTLRVAPEEIRSAQWGAEDILSRYAGKTVGSSFEIRSAVPAGIGFSLLLVIAYSEAEWDVIHAGPGGFGFITDTVRTITLALIALAAVAAIGYLLWRRRSRSRESEERDRTEETRGRSR